MMTIYGFWPLTKNKTKATSYVFCDACSAMNSLVRTNFGVICEKCHAEVTHVVAAVPRPGRQESP